MLNFRLVAIFAAIGAGLSFLTGLFSGIPLGALMLRLILVGMGSALFGAAVSYVLGRFVPELASPRSEPLTEALGEEPETGGDLEKSESEVGANVDISVGDEDVGFVERDLGAQTQDGLGALGFESEREEVDTPRAPIRPPSVLDDLDVLPDLDGLASSFQSEAGSLEDVSDEAVETQTLTPRTSTSRASRGGGVDSNPAEIAKAVRTLLKRDQKG